MVSGWGPTGTLTHIAVDRMLEEAEKLGADAVVGMRIVPADLGTHPVDRNKGMVAYGTAVKLG